MLCATAWAAPPYQYEHTARVDSHYHHSLRTGPNGQYYTDYYLKFALLLWCLHWLWPACGMHTCIHAHTRVYMHTCVWFCGGGPPPPNSPAFWELRTPERAGGSGASGGTQIEIVACWGPSLGHNTSSPETINTDDFVAGGPQVELVECWGPSLGHSTSCPETSKTDDFVAGDPQIEILKYWGNIGLLVQKRSKLTTLFVKAHRSKFVHIGDLLWGITILVLKLSN